MRYRLELIGVLSLSIEHGPEDVWRAADSGLLQLLSRLAEDSLWLTDVLATAHQPLAVASMRFLQILAVIAGWVTADGGEGLWWFGGGRNQNGQSWDW